VPPAPSTTARALALERTNRTDPIGVGGDESFPLAHDRVCGADPGGRRVDGVDEVQDARLVRDRDGELAEAERADSVDGIAQARGGDVERHVERVDPQRRVCSVVHRRRSRVRRRVQHDPA
jgi:hypothetical protein